MVGDNRGFAERHSGRVATYSLPTKTLLHQRLGEDRSLPMSGGVALFGDTDGDGTGDLAVGETDYASVGSVAILSGSDGSLLRRIVPATPNTWFVETVAAVPNLDADGIGEIALDGTAIAALVVGVHPDGQVEIAAGSPESSVAGLRRGAFTVFSAVSAAKVIQRFGSFPSERLGAAVAFVGELSGDLHGEWAVGAPASNKSADAAGRLLVVDGKNGRTFAELRGEKAGDCFATAIAAPGDGDGDGVPDLVVGAPCIGANNLGRVTLFSGSTLGVLARFDGREGGQLGARLLDLGDVNHDGLSEVVMPTDLWNSSVVSLVSLRNGDRVAAIRVDPRYFGETLAALPPWLRDSNPGSFLVIGEPHAALDGR